MEDIPLRLYFCKPFLVTGTHGPYGLEPKMYTRVGVSFSYYGREFWSMAHADTAHPHTTPPKARHGGYTYW